MKTKLLVLGAVVASFCASLQGQPVDKTPVLHLSFDNVSGTTVINGGTGGSVMNGTLNGSATIVTPSIGVEGVDPKFGNALKITGADAASASCRIANAVVPLNVGGSNAWTVAMWIQTYTPGGTYAYQGNGGWADGHTTFYLNAGTALTGTHAGGVRYAQGWQQGTANVNDGLWHHVVMTCDGTNKTLYLDGAVDPFIVGGYDGNSWSALGTGSQFWIGGAGNTGDGTANLNGLVDEVYVFNRALSQADVQMLVDSNTYPHVPVTVTVNPTSGYRGQAFTLTATATPAVGTVTNATADLSALGLSAAANLMESSANVFTNTFTVPVTAPIGASTVKATVTSTEPLIGSSGTTFTVLARPPTNATVVTEIASASVYDYTEASFYFAATNDAPGDAPFPMTYAWFKDSVLVSTNPMGPNFTFLATPGDDGAQIYAIARVADTNFSSIAVTSAVATLTVNPGSTLFTNGLKREFFAGASRQNVEIGNVGPGVVSKVSQAQLAGGYGDNYSQRFSGYFIPPATDSYVFFVASDDDCDVFLSTDNNPANKQLIAQEAGWSGNLSWLAVGGNGSVASQKRSDQWTNSLGVAPYANGIDLVGGQFYYFEAVMHQGTGGDNWAVTYQTTNEIADTNWFVNFVNGTPSRLTAASNNIAFYTYVGTTLDWVVQPQPAVTVNEGDSTNLTCLASSDAEMVLNYQWYLNNAPIPGANGTSVNLASIPASYNGAQLFVIASKQVGGLAITSSVTTLTVQQAVFEVGFLKNERWNGQTSLAGLRNNTLGAPAMKMAVPGFGVSVDNPGGGGINDNFVRRVSGYFVPEVSGDYVFYTTGDDDSDLFVSTDATPVNKRLVCQQNWWNTAAPWGWLTIPTWVGDLQNQIDHTRSSTWSPDGPGGTNRPWANGIPLVAGQKYYIEQLFHQGGGGANNAATFTFLFDPDPTVGTPTRFQGNLIGMSAIRCSYVNFTQQPTNVTVAPMGYATFSADGVTDSTLPIGAMTGLEQTHTNNFLFFQWYKNGAPIPGANSKTLTLGPLLPSDHGAQVYCAMRALGYADNALNPIWTNSQTATITMSGEAIFEPGVVWVDWWTNTTSRLNVENGLAGKPSYSFAAPKFASPQGGSGGSYINRVSAFFRPPTNDYYTFFVNGDDDSDLFVSTNSSPSGKQLAARENGWSNPWQWLTAGGGGSVIGQKRSDQFTPDGINYPFQTGFAMNAGEMYWLEGVHRNGGGNHNFAATYTPTWDYSYPVNGSDTRLSGDKVGIYVPRIPWVSFLQQPTNLTVVSGGNPVTFTAQGTNAPSIWVGTSDNPAPGAWATNPPTLSVQYQWYKNGSPIPGATSSSYTQPFVLPSDDGAQFVCALRALGYADDLGNRIYSNSQPAVLTVITDGVPPSITYAATFQNTNTIPPQLIVNVTFSEWMDPATMTNIANYSISGVNITNATLASNNRTVELTVDQMPTLPMVIEVNGVTDLSGNALTNNSIAINPVKLTFTDVGFPPYYDYAFGQPGYDPSYPSIIRVIGNGSYIVSAQGSDIYNTADGFNFGWEWKTNDFDVVVRGVSNGHSSHWAKMGLMVREDLTASSRNWNIVNTPNPNDGVMAPDNSGYGANLVLADRRDAIGAASVTWLTTGSPAPAYPNAWLRIKRTGPVLSGYYSTNGMTWVQIANYDSSTNVNGSLSNVVHVGICTTGHNNDIVTTLPAPPPVYYNTAEYAGYNSAYVPANPATLLVSRSGSDVIVSWTPAGGHLESSPAIAGPGVNWQNVGTNNPATVPIGPGAQFFRVVNP